MQTELQLWSDPSGDERPPRPPGFYIVELLKERGWNQADLASITGRPLPTINEIINAKRGITPEMSVVLGRAFGTSPELWAHREAAFRLSIVNQSDGETALRARLFQLAPVNEMLKRGWIKSVESVADLEKELCRFFGISSIDDELGMNALARKTFKGEDFSSIQRVWLIQASRMAAVLKVREYTQSALQAGLTELRKQASRPEQSRFVPVILAEMGIRFVVVESLPKARIDGAAFFLDGDLSQPVIVLSLRFDRMDCFWFTLIHETRHIINRDPLSFDTNIVGELKATGINDVESRADREAADWLIPSKELDSFVLRAKPHFAKERIIQFASRMKVHPSIVVGQLQHRKVVPWKYHKDLNSTVNEHVISTSMTDGWNKHANI